MSFFRRLFGLSTPKKEKVMAVGSGALDSSDISDPDTYEIALARMDATMIEIHTMTHQWVVDIEDMEDDGEESDEE